MNNYQLTMGNFISLMESVSNESDKQTDNEGNIWLNTESNYPLFNGVYNFGKIKNLSASLTHSKLFFEQNPFTWWHMGEDNLSSAQIEILNKNGLYSAGPYSGIKLNLDTFSEKDLPTGKIKIVRVNHEHDTFCNILNEVFQLTNEIATEFKILLNPVNTSLVSYLGYFDEKPVGTLTMYLNKDTIGLYCGGTLPVARKKGILTALINQALIDAKNYGSTTAVAQLMAKNMAETVTKTFGFEVVCHFTPYVYGSDPDTLEP